MTEAESGVPAESDDGFAFGQDPTMAARTTLAEVLEALGPVVLHPLVLPDESSSITVGELVIYDPAMRLPSERGAVLLAVGRGLEDEETQPLIREASAAGFSAVVIKARGGDPTAARFTAESCSIALLLVPDEMPWRQVDSLITATTSASGQVRDSYASSGPGDLFAVANAIAFSVGGATTIEDTRGHVLAYSNLPHQEIDEVRRRGILGRQTPERPTNMEEYALVFKSDGPYRFYPEIPGYMDRLAIAVRAGAELLGIIWVLDGAPPLRPDAEAAIEEAARVTALHLLRARGHRDTDRWRRGEVLSSFLGGSVAGKVAAERLGIAYDTRTTVIALSHAEVTTSRGLETARIVDLVNLYCEAWHPDACCTPMAGVIYAILPSDDKSERRMRLFSEELVAVVERSTSVAVHVAIGPFAAELDQVPRSRQAADLVLRALSKGPSTTQVASIDDVRSRAILLEISEQDPAVLRLTHDPVTEIHAYDTENSTAYGMTLLTYLDMFGDANRAAGRLSIHENTLRYRIRRANKLFAIDLDDPDSRLVLWLQLRLQTLTGRP